MAEKLLFNTANAVTAQLERCHLQGQPAVRKVLNGRNSPQTPSSWRASTQPSHWNYWRREYCVYTSDLAEWVAPAQIHLPALLRAESDYQQQSHQIELVLEDLGDCGGLKIKHSHYPEIVRRWARAQALLSQQEQLRSRDLQLAACSPRKEQLTRQARARAASPLVRALCGKGPNSKESTLPWPCPTKHPHFADLFLVAACNFQFCSPLR